MERSNGSPGTRCVELDDIKLPTSCAPHDVTLVPVHPKSGDLGTVSCPQSHRVAFDERLSHLLKQMEEHISHEHAQSIVFHQRHLEERLTALSKENQGLREQLGVAAPSPLEKENDLEGPVFAELISMSHNASSLKSATDSELTQGHQVDVAHPKHHMQGKSAHLRTNGARRKPSQEMSNEPNQAFELWNCWVSSKELKMAQSMRLTDSTLSSGERANGGLSFCAETAGASQEPCLLSPASNVFLAWQFLFTLVLSYELVMFPMSVFGVDQFSGVKSVAWATASFWTMDIFVVLNTGIYDSKGQLLLARHKILLRYLRTWFLPDVCVVALDWVMLLDTGGGNSQLLRFGKLLRYLRMARLLRLLRLRKLKEVMRRLDDYINSVYFTALKSIVVNMVTIIVISHFLGCAWYAVGRMQIDGYTSWVEAHSFEEVDWEYAYLTSLHWSITQFTPGSMNVQPQNIPERAFAVGMLVMGMILFSSIVSNITMATNNLKQITARYDRDLTMLRRFLTQENISTNLTRRVVRYTDAVVKPKLLKIATRDVELLKYLPLPLYQEVVAELYDQYVDLNPFFWESHSLYPTFMRKLCFSALGETCLANDCALFGPGECADSMYILVKGQMEYVHDRHSKEVLAPDFFVEMVLWCPWMFQGRMTAAAECELLRINSNSFRDMALQYSMCLKDFAAYGAKFVAALNEEVKSGGEITDVTKVVHTAEDLERARSGPPLRKGNPSGETME